MVVDESREPSRRRGTVLLFTTIIIVATITGLSIIPQSYTDPDLTIRVAVIDSGIDIDHELETRVVAGKSFVNTAFGYIEDDNSTTDSSPGDVSHGTFIATENDIVIVKSLLLRMISRLPWLLSKQYDGLSLRRIVA